MRRRTILGVAAGVVVLAAAGGVAAWLLLARPGPDDAARAYLEALASSDAGAVFAHVEGGRDAHAAAVEAFSGATERISDERVVAVAVDADTATVDAEASLGGETYDMSFTLTRDGDRWLVSSGFLGEARLTATLGDAVTIGDAVVGEGAVELLPARYTVTGAPADLVTGSADVDVLPDRSTSVSVETALSDAAISEAQRQIDVYAGTCTTGGATVPEACGLRVPWPADFTAASRFAYRVERTPVLRIDARGGGFVADGGDVTVTVTGTPRGDGPPAVTYRNDAWTLRGALVLDADGLTLSVR
jgi:hypothetical protein